MKIWCKRCGFKFEQNAKGRKAEVCPSCRTQRENDWRSAQEEKAKKKPKKEPEIEAV